MNGIPAVADLSTLDVFLWDVDSVLGKAFEGIDRRRVQKHENTLQLTGYKSLI